MKTIKLRSFALVGATVVALALLSACGTTSGYKQADKTGAGIAQFRDEILKAQKAIDATLGALEGVAASATTDPRKAYEAYVKAVAALESSAESVKKRSEAMKEQGQAYFNQWQKELAEVTNPDIRALAEKRKAKLQASFDNIRQFSEPLKAKFTPWMSDLKDLQKYLANDLTIEGVDAAKPLFTKTSAGGADVKKSMDGLVAELNTIAATLTPSKVPEK